MAEKPMEILTGTVEDIVFHSEDTGFTVLVLDDGEEMRTVVGEVLDPSVGEELKVTGTYGNHPTYGPQFKATLIERSLPATGNAILKYLASGAIKGIGPVLARRMVLAFGNKTLEIIEKEPALLSEIQGISPKKAEEIRYEFNRLFGIRSVMQFLSSLGIEPATSIRVWKRWGTSSQEVIAHNPYLLCGEEIGMKFEAADRIAQHFGVEKENPNRLKAGLAYVLRHNLANGHTCLPERQLLSIACGLLEVEEEQVLEAERQGEREEEILADTVQEIRYLYLPHMYQAETYVAGRLAMMCQLDQKEDQDFSDQIALLEQENQVQYAQRQRQAINRALSHNLFILTGGPGTGKTTTVNAIIELLEQQGSKVLLAAPTGRAAKRLSEVTGREAKTIHRLLEVDFQDKETGLNRFKRNEKNPINADVVIVDEMSMVDILLFECLVRALKMSARLIMVGDSDQLPSVGAGNVLKDLINSEQIAMVRLDEIFRQAAQSLIVTNAHAIVKGEMPELRKKDNDFFFLPSGNYAKTAQLVVDLCKTRLPKSYQYSPLWDIQVMTPNRVGEIGTIELNRILQEALNPKTGEKREFRSGPYLFREADKVMQVKNNYDIVWVKEDGEKGTGVYNGDIGTIQMIDKASHVFVVKYEDKTVTYNMDNGDELELAYAITVHKSQGCEFEAVILPLMNRHPKLYHRNLFYTAVTRAKKLLILIGQEGTIGSMVSNNRKTMRYTNLSRFLQEAASP